MLEIASPCGIVGCVAYAHFVGWNVHARLTAFKYVLTHVGSICRLQSNCQVMRCYLRFVCVGFKRAHVERLATDRLDFVTYINQSQAKATAESLVAYRFHVAKVYACDELALIECA